MNGAITDVFAFAASHGDYWEQILHEDASYDDVLSPEEQKAFGAARLHIEESISGLLRACKDRFVQINQVRDKPFDVAARSSVNAKEIRPVKKIHKKLFYGSFLFRKDGRDGHIKLVSSIAVHNKIIQDVGKSLQDANLKFEVRGSYFLDAPGIALERGELFTTVADRAAEVLMKLLDASMS
ncbi:hypothetical protein [Chondromyces crocatus]|uniref:Uncharacterized protein n=1 Tax=Chondromyces crocatus TaxID=52 RepID=A0A0K1EIF6_CHOCO|nr:hypothetical protein [Chondromyces crocatus]AKT40378.1 uncharacterized protein CMC5_045310 [Chondromyces crocatus]